ncbi:MAG: nucleotide exchange factor GrpE [Clostridiales bacterium]|nr:nucleotide exchange factor GrpE [Clostridiales bacterium]
MSQLYALPADASAYDYYVYSIDNNAGETYALEILRRVQVELDSLYSCTLLDAIYKSKELCRYFAKSIIEMCMARIDNFEWPEPEAYAQQYRYPWAPVKPEDVIYIRSDLETIINDSAGRKARNSGAISPMFSKVNQPKDIGAAPEKKLSIPMERPAAFPERIQYLEKSPGQFPERPKYAEKPSIQFSERALYSENSSGQYPAQPPSGQYPPQPSSGQYPQPPSSSQFPQPPSSGQYPQPPSSGQYPQPPSSGQYPQPPSSSQFSQPPSSSQFSQPAFQDSLKFSDSMGSYPEKNFSMNDKQALEREIEEQKSMLRSLQAECRSNESKLEETRKDLWDLNELLGKSTANFSMIDTARKNSEDRLSEIKLLINEELGKLDHSKAQIDAQTVEIQKLSAEIQRLEGKKSGLQEEIEAKTAELEAEYERSLKQNEAKRAEIEAGLEKDRLEAEISLKAIRAEIDAAKEEIKKVNAEKSRMESEAAKYKEEAYSYREKAEEIERIIQASMDSGPMGAILSSFAEEYESLRNARQEVMRRAEEERDGIINSAVTGAKKEAQKISEIFTFLEKAEIEAGKMLDVLTRISSLPASAQDPGQPSQMDLAKDLGAIIGEVNQKQDGLDLRMKSVVNRMAELESNLAQREFEDLLVSFSILQKSIKFHRDIYNGDEFYKKVTRFENRFLQNVKRLGLLSYAPRIGEVFDPKEHEVEEEYDYGVKYRVSGVKAHGFVYKDKLLKRPCVSIEPW